MATSSRRGRRPKKNGRPEQQTSRLQTWLDENGFTSAELAAATAVSRQAMTKIRAEQGDVRRTTMRRLLGGACLIAKRKVSMDELFDLEPEKWRE